MRIRWTTSALTDLKNISVYIELRQSISVANRICRIIYDTVQILRRFPESGKRGIEEGTRDFVVPTLPSYIIAYRIVSQEVVEVLRIWHGAQNRDQ